MQTLRLTAGVLALFLAASTSFAQSLEDRLEKKLEKPFAKNAAWVLDLETAKTKAKETGKPIFAYFTRSYAP